MLWDVFQPKPKGITKVWLKMNVGPNVAKKRKKSESKPQLQLNKCLNEKRRREQENIYIEELAELISASISDMSSLSVKPDKCAILQETVNQIRRITQESGHSDELQQSEVSSSKPTILANDVLGPILLEALDGFLFAVNTDGKIEYVSENVTSFLKYRQDDLVGTIIYSIIHVGDHGRFSSNLLPMSIGNGFSWTSEPSSGTNNKSRSFNCRFLIKPPEDQDETMDEKQTRLPQYENTQISAVSLPYSEQTDNSESRSELHNYLVCVARRIPPNERNSSSAVEQFTTRLDLTGKILAIDTSGVSSLYSKYLNKDLVGRLIQELCHPSDLQRINQHLKESLQTGSNTSGIYRLRVTQEKYIFVQTKSKRFSSSQVGNEQEFIMATHSIIRDSDAPRGIENNPLGNQRTNISPVPSTSATSSNGPGLANINGSSMVGTSVQNSVPVSTTSFTNFHSLSPSSHELSLSELALDIFPSSSWDLNVRDSALGETLSTSLTTSQHGVNTYTTVSSPSLPTISNSTSSTSSRMSSQGAQTIAQQQMNRAFSPDIISGRGSQSHSPVAQLSSTSSPGPIQGSAYGSTFPFSPVQSHMQPASGKSSPAIASTTMRKSEENPGYSIDASSPVTNLIPDCQAVVRATQKLRDLLTQGIEEADSSVSKPSVNDGDLPSSSASECESALAMKLSQSVISVSAASSSRNENIILRELLNQEDEDGEFGGKAMHRLSDNKSGLPSTTLSVDSCSGDFLESQKKSLANSSNNNNMLRKLLNNDEEGDKNYRKNQDLLIHHLLKAESPEKAGVDPTSSSGSPVNEVYRNVCNSVAKRKTAEDNSDGGCDSAPKRMNANVHAQLAGQNPMLASMLAKTPPTLPSVPTSIANSIISQLPQDRLPKNLEKKLVHTPLPGGGNSAVNNVLTISGASVSQGRTAQPGSRSLLVPSSVQQELVSNEVRTQVMQQHSAIPVTNGSYTQTQVEHHHGFLSKILTTSEGSVQLTRTLQASVSSSSLSHQHTLQTSNSYGQFHQTVQNVSQASASSSLNIPELMESGQSLDPTGGQGVSNPLPSAVPDLSEILDQVWSMQQEMNIETVTSDETALLKFLDEDDVPEPQEASPGAQSHPLPPQTPQDLNEKMAIIAIQRQLMSFEGLPNNGAAFTTTTTTNVNTLPSYSQSGTGQHIVTVSQSQLSPTSSIGPYSTTSPYQNVPQPPAYNSSLLPGQRPRLPVSVTGPGIVHGGQQVIGIGGIPRSGLLQYGAGSIPANIPPQIRRSLYERRQKLYLHQQQKRLLAQQQQQQLTMQTQQPMSDALVPPGPGGFPENMNDLINNTVAPNVTLQRSSGLPEQQLSPRYGNNLMGQLPSPVGQPQPQSQLSPSQRVVQQRSYSPLPQQSFQSPTPQTASYQQHQQQHRLSPHPLPSYPQSGQGPSPSPISSAGGGGPRSPHLQLSPQPNSGQMQWNQRAPPSPAPVNLQQQNPMLNAQLSQGSFAAQNRFAGPQRQLSVRSMPSPSSVAGQRNSPFATQPDSSYTPHSPVNVYSSGSASKQSQPPPQPQQPQRLQRAISVPVRVNSPRTSQSAYMTSESMLSPQSSPGYNQSIPSTIASSFSNSNALTSSAPIYSLAQENSHFSFEQQNLQMFPAQASAGDRNRVASGGIQVSSEYVRQELRAMVGARTQQQQQQQQGQAQQQVMHQISMSSRTPPNQQPSNQSLDLEVLGLQLDLVTGDDQMSVSSLYQQPPLLSIASNQGSPLPAQQRSANSPRVDESQPSGQTRSLLQQLLSEPP